MRIKGNIVVFFFIFAVSFVLSGCVEAPDEVKEEMKKINEAKKEQKEINKEIRFIEASELRNEAQEGLLMDYGVLRFQGDVVVPECENVYLLEMKVNDEIYKNLDENVLRIMEYIGIEENDWEKYITEEKGINESLGYNSATGKVYDDEGYCRVEIGENYISINRSGRISIDQGIKDKGHPYFLNAGKIIENYYFINNRGKYLGKEIDLNGKKVTLQELEDSFEKGVKLINKCSPNLNLILHDVRVVEIEETKNIMLVIRALGSYRGVCFDSNYIFPQDSESMGGKSFVGFEMNQQIHEVEDVCKTSLRETSYIAKREMKEYNEVIDFESALHLIAKTAPKDKITTIESAEFVYQIYYEGEEGQAWNYSCQVPPVFFATPVWKFVEKDRSSEMKATVYYVDAVSGEIYSFYKSCTP